MDARPLCKPYRRSAHAQSPTVADSLVFQLTLGRDSVDVVVSTKKTASTPSLKYNMVLVANSLRPFVQLTPRAELSSLGSCLELCPAGEAEMDQGI